jgi:glycosyltransferase involved in cell wall biosynthesis
MLNGQKITLIPPAYNAELTLKSTIEEIPVDIVDDLILVDDCSTEATARLALDLGIHTLKHSVNRGYGGNQ